MVNSDPRVAGGGLSDMKALRATEGRDFVGRAALADAGGEESWFRLPATVSFVRGVPFSVLEDCPVLFIEGASEDVVSFRGKGNSSGGGIGITFGPLCGAASAVIMDYSEWRIE